MAMNSSVRITAELKNLAIIRHFVQETATVLGGDPDATSQMLLAVTEAVTNIIVHGYHDQPGTIEIDAGREGDALMVCLRDQAPPFDPTTVPSPDLTLPLGQRPLGGVGIHMMRQLTDEVTHRLTPQGGNELTLVKKGVVGNGGKRWR